MLDEAGRGDEFAVMAALQFVRYLNSANEYVVVHGANLSLSIPHEISNYACGRTPVCDECERVVSSGVVVVAAAGNQGRQRYTTAAGRVAEAYLSISITDPGNADLVITVGATHRYRPHTYGVSYFSSRGPTGDGRIKPDLVAPGEKITAPVPEGAFGLKDGTSMAAPHVSGAAALLMARHNELVGRPARLKQILCSTATDLGRERYFQGAGHAGRAARPAVGLTGGAAASRPTAGRRGCQEEAPMLVLEALRAQFGDALILHSGTGEARSSPSSTAGRPASTTTRCGRDWRRSAPSAGSTPGRLSTSS